VARYLLDSDVIIWCLRGRRDTVQLVEGLQRESVPHCSALSVIEVEVGMKIGEEKTTRAFLGALRIEPVDGNVAQLVASYMRQYRRRGTTLDLVDASIAATCVVRGLLLVTYNVKHYPVPEVIFYPAVGTR
jgi:predicted nucleic acid-binding protein